jgi:hypothetical protein
MDEKKNLTYFTEKGVVTRWKIINEAGIIFAVSYQESFSVLYTDQLIDMVSKEFMNNFYTKLNRIGKVFIDNPDFANAFKSILTKWEKYCQDIIEYILFFKIETIVKLLKSKPIP